VPAIMCSQRAATMRSGASVRGDHHGRARHEPISSTADRGRSRALPPSRKAGRRGLSTAGHPSHVEIAASLSRRVYIDAPGVHLCDTSLVRVARTVLSLLLVAWSDSAGAADRFRRLGQLPLAFEENLGQTDSAGGVSRPRHRIPPFPDPDRSRCIDSARGQR